MIAGSRVGVQRVCTRKRCSTANGRQRKGSRVISTNFFGGSWTVFVGLGQVAAGAGATSGRGNT